MQRKWIGDLQQFTARLSGGRVVDRGDKNKSAIRRNGQVAVVRAGQLDGLNQPALGREDGKATASIQRDEHVSILVDTNTVRRETRFSRSRQGVSQIDELLAIAQPAIRVDCIGQQPVPMLAAVERAACVAPA